MKLWGPKYQNLIDSIWAAGFKFTSLHNGAQPPLITELKQKLSCDWTLGTVLQKVLLLSSPLHFLTLLFHNFLETVASSLYFSKKKKKLTLFKHIPNLLCFLLVDKISSHRPTHFGNFKPLWASSPPWSWSWVPLGNGLGLGIQKKSLYHRH